ncbi:MAG: energy transducer TonB [Cyanobacteria bacterium]|nr:energy transducer TonB [Cyanobacteriota bacterium]
MNKPALILLAAFLLLSAPARSEEPQAPPSDGKTIKLTGNAIESNLAIEWNSWHNRFARAVRKGLFQSEFEAVNTKSGTMTKYHCDVSSDRKINNLKIVRSSGDFWFDARVIKAVNKLDGTSILAFPEKSIRNEVSVDLAVRYGGRRRNGEIIFEDVDVEYRELTPEEAAQMNKGSAEDTPTKRMK